MVITTWRENLREMARFQGKNERQKPKRLARKEGGVICLLRSLKTQKGTKHTKNTLNPVVAYLAGCVSKNKKAQNTQIPASHFVCFVYSCVTDTQPQSRAVTGFRPFFVCFVCFREIKKGHKAPVGVVTVKQAGSSCASSSLFLPLRSRGLLASR